MKSCPSGWDVVAVTILGGRALSHVRLPRAFQRALSFFDAVPSEEGLESQGGGEDSDTSLLPARVPPDFVAVQEWTQRIMVT